MSTFESFNDEFTDNAGLVPLEPVEALRNFTMSTMRSAARRVRRIPEKRKHQFVIFDDSGGEVGSDLIDSYLGVSIARPEYRQHTMKISFLEMLLSESERYSNHRELYLFDWVDGEQVFARKKTKAIKGDIRDTIIKDDGSIVDIVVPTVLETFTVLTETDCHELKNRMLRYTEAASLERAA